MAHKSLNSLGVSRVHIPTGTTKVEQLVDTPSWSQTERKLEELARTGPLTLKEATKNRLVLQWEPRIFPAIEILPQARQTLRVVKYDLTLAFNDQQDRETFTHRLIQSGLLVKSTDPL